MRLTLFTDYSLRVLMYTALVPDRLVTVAELSKAYDISINHIMKIVHFLAQQGYLETIRGKGGGMRLQRAPADINLGQLVRTTEVNDTLVECFDSASSKCRIDGHGCMVGAVLRKAQHAFFEELSGHTLDDLLRRSDKMAIALDLPIKPLAMTPAAEAATA